MSLIIRGLILTIMAGVLLDSAEARPAEERRVFVAGGSNQIEIFSLDLTTGALKKVGVGSIRPGAPGGSPYLAWDPGQRFLFSLDRVEPSQVVSLAIDRHKGSLKPINRVEVGPGSPPHLSVHKSGRWVLVAHYNATDGGYASVLPVGADGTLGSPQVKIPVGLKTHMIISDPSGRFVFVPCTNSNYIAQYVFDAGSGELRPNDPPTAASPAGAGPRHMAFHPTLPLAYVINETASTLTSFAYDPHRGTLSESETLDTLPSTFDRKQNSTAHVLVSPSGKFVYGSNRGHDSIVIFSIDPKTGRLHRIGWEQAGGRIKTPRNFAIDPGGKFLLVANQDSDSVIVFRIGVDGSLSPQGDAVPTGPKPTFIGVLAPL
jgi:6-phosphogluconolactonase